MPAERYLVLTRTGNGSSLSGSQIRPRILGDAQDYSW